MNTKAKSWVAERVEKFWTTEKKHPSTFGGMQVNRRISVVNLTTSAIGVATCSTEDVFNFDLGLAIAYARCIGETVPDYVINADKEIKRLADLEIGTKFKRENSDEVWILCNKRSSDYLCYSPTRNHMAVVSRRTREGVYVID